MYLIKNERSDCSEGCVTVHALAATLEGRPGFAGSRAIVMAGELVRSLREEANLTQTALAKKAGTTQARISLIEKGTCRSGPSIELLARIAFACNKRLLLKAC